MGRTRWLRRDPEVEARLWDDWRWQWENRITTAGALTERLDLTDGEAEGLRLGGRTPFALTPYYFSLIRPDDPHDPIRRQCLPTRAEWTGEGHCVDDPLDEDAEMPVDGIVHRYPDRCLFLVSDRCPVYCRHCTRRRLWERRGHRSIDELGPLLDYVRQTPEIRDVLVSGGDPLCLPLPALRRCLEELRAMSHVSILRIGSRVPVVLPQRITPDLLEVLAGAFPLWIHTHFNHPRELTPEAAEACGRLLRTGVQMGNQAVLLKGINDDPETQIALSRGLLSMGVRPYYLFHCDPVRGAAHFRTPVARGIEILESLRGRIGGMGMPHYAVDTGAEGKVILAPQALLERDGDVLLLRNHAGRTIRYPDGGRD